MAKRAKPSSPSGSHPDPLAVHGLTNPLKADMFFVKWTQS
jgi:hypothetical protein